MPETMTSLARYGTELCLWSFLIRAASDVVRCTCFQMVVVMMIALETFLEGCDC